MSPNDPEDSTLVAKGHSPKLRAICRTRKVNLASLAKQLHQGINTDFQAADIFTKALPPRKWGHALRLLGGMRTDLPEELEDTRFKIMT